MINLLPEQDKKAFLIEYRLRLAVIGLLLFAIVVFIGIILLAPSYFISFYDKNVALNQIAGVNQDALQENKQLRSQVEQIKQKTAILNQNSQAVLSTKVIDTVLNYRGQNKILALNYSPVDKKVVVGGIAPTRQSLIIFTDSLKAEPLVSAVEFPISSLAQDTNIKFSVTITLKE